MRNIPAAAIMSAAAVLACLPKPAEALVREEFTPVDLVRQSDTILKVRITVNEKGTELKFEVLEAFKGDKPAKPVLVDLTQSPHEGHQSEFLVQMMRKAGKEGNLAVLFLGKYKQRKAADEQAGKGADETFVESAFFADGYVHLIGGSWLSLYHSEGGGLEFDKFDSSMGPVWRGSVDMTERLVRYVLSDPQADVPADTGAHWGWHKQSAKGVTGAAEARAVLLGDGLAQALWIARPDGDRLLAYDAEKQNLVDVTAKHKLAARSRAGVWGDFNRDGRADLLSHDGAKLTLHTQQKDGTFAAADVRLPEPLGQASGLSVCDINADGRADVIVSTPGWPVLLTNDGNGAFSARPLGKGERLAIELSADQVKEGWKQVAGRCVVADLDGDARPDVLQPFSAGGAFYKGTPDGFAAPVVSAVGLGKQPAVAAATADFDADGLLDIFTAGGDRPRIWQNRGQARFDEMLDQSGQISYISQPEAVAVDIGDFNNDGRQDCLIAFAAGCPPQLYFNRGFRCLGFAYSLGIYTTDLLPQAQEHGALAACFGDFNGDGGEDMAVVVANGEVWTFLRAVKYEDKWTKGPVVHPTLGVRVTLDARGGYAGPVNVVGWDGERCLGAWRVDSGSASAWIARRAPGKIKLTWQLPGGQAQTKTVQLDEKPVRLTLGR